MILFVFEGDDREPRLYRTLEGYTSRKRTTISSVLSGIISMTYTTNCKNMMEMVILLLLCENVLPIEAMLLWMV